MTNPYLAQTNLAQTNLAQAKFQLTSNLALPAKCVACNVNQSNDVPEMVDFNVSFDFEGAILLCPNCCSQIARDCLGMVLPEEIETFEGSVKTLFDQLEEEKARVRALCDVLTTFGFVGADSLDYSNPDAPIHQVATLRESLSKNPSDGPSESATG